MDTERFDQIAAAMVTTASRRQVLGGVLGSVSALLLHEGSLARRKRKQKAKRCKDRKSRCDGKCGSKCAAGERCLNGRCFSQDTCPSAQKACPNFVRCGAAGEDCFCGTTTMSETVCFQDDNFCEAPRPCQSSSDCEGGRVCIDSTQCCADFGLPDVPRTCVLPCANLDGTAKLAAPGAASGPGEARQ